MVKKEVTAETVMTLLLAQNTYDALFKSDVVMNLLRDPKENFDAVITEWFFFDGIAGIASVLECPLIWLGTTEAHWNLLKLIDDISNPAYTTDIISSNNTPLSFWERASELLNIIWMRFLSSVLFIVNEKSWFDKVFSDIAEKRGVPVPFYEDAVYNGSFLLLNSHPSYGKPFKLPQNAKYIGGFHVQNTIKPLPKDFKKIMEEAKHGVIYFSMGSNFKSSDMSTEMKRTLIDMFGKLKETVIWKFETDIDNVPENLHLAKWAPQESILAHPNLKMFITHGGQLSTTEAIHYGVPIIGIPLMADQHVNMNTVVKNGYGIKVKLSVDLHLELGKAIQSILEDSSYTDRAKAVSGLYHDRYMPPGKELVYWVEHVIRTRGALHLRSPALMVPWYQKMYLDLLAFISSILVMIILLVRIVRSTFNNKPVNKRKKLQ